MLLGILFLGFIISWINNTLSHKSSLAIMFDLLKCGDMAPRWSTNSSNLYHHGHSQIT